MSKARKIILLAAVFAAAFALGNAVKYYLDIWKADRNVKSFQSAFDALYKDDAYGGKTPEETFDLYLAALKKGDLELASRYFAPNKQKEELIALMSKRDGGEIASYTAKFENVKLNWRKKESTFFDWQIYAAYEYPTVVKKMETINFVNPTTGKSEKVSISPGTYYEIVQFEKNNNLWKLYLM